MNGSPFNSAICSLHQKLPYVKNYPKLFVGCAQQQIIVAQCMVMCFMICFHESTPITEGAIATYTYQQGFKQESQTNSINMEVESTLSWDLLTLQMIACLGCMFGQKDLAHPGL